MKTNSTHNSSIRSDEGLTLETSFFQIFHGGVRPLSSDDTFEIKLTRHVSVVQRPSSVESRINLKLHLNL